MKSKSNLLTCVLLSSTLVACGGGGGDAVAPGTQSVVIAASEAAVAVGPSTGSVSAPFVRSASARYIIVYGLSSQTGGSLKNSAQDASGAMTTLNATSLSGGTVVKEISGNASYAQGRWEAGTVTDSNGSKIITGADSTSYQYAAFNDLAARPTSGSAVCDSGSFTAPHRVAGGTPSSAKMAAGAGTASIAFNANSAVITGAITATADGSTGSTAFNTSLESASSTSYTGLFLGGGTGAAVSLATDGATGYLVVLAYSVKLANGATYLGVANFRCQ